MDVVEKNNSNINFLATQVWPSARVAALALQTAPGSGLDDDQRIRMWSGPPLDDDGRRLGRPKGPHATDLDPFALSLVRTASWAQGFQAIVRTQPIDLTMDDDNHADLPVADLHLFSDVFESW